MNSRHSQRQSCQLTSHLVTRQQSKHRSDQQWPGFAAVSALVASKPEISALAQGVGDLSNLVTPAPLRSIRAHIPDATRAMLALGSRAADRRSNLDFPACRASAPGWPSCSPHGTSPRSNIAAESGCVGGSEIAAGSTGIDVACSFSIPGSPWAASCRMARLYPIKHGLLICSHHHRCYDFDTGMAS
jgi:hypothetical protein